MAEQKSRIYSLPEITEINDDMYLMLDASDTGARRFNLKTFYDKVDGVQASADAANTAATAAAAAVDSANQAAQQAASAAESASTTVQGLVEDVNEAIEAVGDVTELAVPTMSPTVKGGAKLGTGLEVTDDTLSVNTVSSGDGSQAGPILSLSAKGWAEQDTTTGKNLLNIPDFTYTKNSDGANGTSRDDSIRIQSGTTITLSFEARRSSGASAPSIYLYVGNRDTPLNSVRLVAASTEWTRVTKTVTPNNDVNISWITIGSAPDSNGTSYEMRNCQIELGSTATAYEPYTGGAPSPSPDYPQEIRVCKGRNLLNYEAWRGTAITRGTAVWENNGVTITATTNDCYTDYNNTFSENARVRVSEGQTITLSWAADTNAGGYIYIFPNGSTTGLVSTNNSTAKNLTYTAGADVTYVSFRFGVATAGTTIRYSDIQIERGSVATPYVPYGYVGMDVWSSKNLIRWMYDNTALNGTTGATVDVDTYHTSNYIPVTGGEKYAISGLSQLVICWYDSDKSYISTTRTAVTTAPSNSRYARIASIKDGYPNPMFEKGSQATAYEPYHHSTTPIPLPSRGWVASLPDGTADTLTLDGAGKVTWEEKTGEATFDGSSDESWVVTSASGTFGIGGSYVKQSYNMKIGHFDNCYADKYITSTSKIADMGNNTFKIGDALYFVNRSISTVADFRDWLSTHPVTVLYPLATPVTEERGYVEMPQVPVGAKISIPELDDLGVKYCVDASALEMARMWYGKAKSEYAEELAELRMTVSELATRIS